MGRRNAVDVCLLCTQAPCRCGKAPKPEKPPRQPRKRAAKTETKPKCGWCTDEERAAGMPCACNAPKPDAPIDPPAAPSEPHPLDTPPTVKASARAAMKAAAARSRTARPAPRSSDPIMDDAIRALEPVLHPDERSKFREVLTRPRMTGVRAMAWKQRRVDRRGDSAG